MHGLDEIKAMNKEATEAVSTVAVPHKVWAYVLLQLEHIASAPVQQAVDYGCAGLMLRYLRAVAQNTLAFANGEQDFEETRQQALERDRAAFDEALETVERLKQHDDEQEQPQAQVA